MKNPKDFILKGGFYSFSTKYFSLSSEVTFKTHYNSLRKYVVIFDEIIPFISFYYDATWIDEFGNEKGDEGDFIVDERLRNSLNEVIQRSKISISESINYEEIKKLQFYGREAQTLVAENEFYKSYPNYVEGIVKLIEFINDIKEFKKAKGSRERKKSTHGEKTVKAYELESLCDKLLAAEDHESAIDIIKEEYPEFKWDNPHRFLTKNNGESNKSQIARALALVAEIKFDDPPNEETIRATLLK